MKAEEREVLRGTAVEHLALALRDVTDFETVEMIADYVVGEQVRALDLHRLSHEDIAMPADAKPAQRLTAAVVRERGLSHRRMQVLVALLEMGAIDEQHPVTVNHVHQFVNDRLAEHGIRLAESTASATVKGLKKMGLIEEDEVVTILNTRGNPAHPHWLTKDGWEIALLMREPVEWDR